MGGLNLRGLAQWATCATLVLVSVSQASAQLVWQQEMKEFSVVLPLTLDNNVIRIRAKPPEGVKPLDINCDIGITGTVLTDQRGTSASDAGEQVVGGLRSHDDIDVQFADRVWTGNRDLVGNRIIEKYDFDCGINIKYQNKLKVAQVEIRVGYVLPSGDIEGLTWGKLARKRRIYEKNIQKCVQYRDDIADMDSRRTLLISESNSDAQARVRNVGTIAALEKKMRRLEKFASREDEFRRDLAAFRSIDEYLKTKIHGTQIFVHFSYNGETLPADLDELKRSHVRPIQVFAEGNDPILNR
jgi:hypothetical protein